MFASKAARFSAIASKTTKVRKPSQDINWNAAMRLGRNWNWEYVVGIED